eukprot:432674-Pleurochrysis_carterae.AAC.1
MALNVSASNATQTAEINDIINATVAALRHATETLGRVSDCGRSLLVAITDLIAVTDAVLDLSIRLLSGIALAGECTQPRLAWVAVR